MAHILESDLSIELIYKQMTALQEQNRVLQEQNIAFQKKLDEREQVILELRANLTTLQNLLFGTSSEQTQNENTGSGNNGEGESEGSSKGSGSKGSKGKKGGHRNRRDHSKLPLIETSIDLPEDKKKCPCCGLDFQYVNDVEEGETIEIEVQGYRRRIRRRSYARRCKCPGGGSKIITASSPGKLIPKGSIGTSVWIKMLQEMLDGLSVESSITNPDPPE